MGKISPVEQFESTKHVRVSLAVAVADAAAVVATGAEEAAIVNWMLS